MRGRENSLIHGELLQSKWEVDNLDQVHHKIFQETRIGIFNQVLIPKNFSERFLVKQVFKEGTSGKNLLNQGLGLVLPKR